MRSVDEPPRQIYKSVRSKGDGRPAALQSVRKVVVVALSLFAIAVLLVVILSLI